MGQQILGYYKEAQELGGLKAKMRMAMISGIPSPKAEAEPDTAANLEKIKAALFEIKKEFK